ncbi:murein biosynthesis integral membrane protein MurJ [Thalassotalea euphylliae]|uniref:Probable lipid II flippase MurJ n=1 Tax=Thalassotalea euphylliae TaxID=1655234 RepID=A0A3E0U082_9GAMM|nr:murein biosynthesis integral membrane protein MurJ [Thalassotalea euphylliae]REL30326.1 murein biosynthesis integral membrane protein MurJ [Thalassotalea euphylliae]
MSKKLIKSGIIVSAMTMISRVLGLVRDVVIANFMGTGAGADVFFFANKIPNFLRRLFAEGAFAQAFVPVLSEYQAQDEKSGTDETRKLIAQVSGTLGVVISLVTLFGMIASPVIVALFGFGWFLDWWHGGEQGTKFELASTLLKITFPYLWFISLTALAGAILNTLGKFAAAAFTPVLLNVCIIASAIFLTPYFDLPAYALAWGVFFGGLVQFLFQLPFLYRAGVLVKPKWAWHAPGVAKIRKLIVPALFGVSVTQINLLLDTLIASFLVTGSISWLYYADRLLEFPLGLFGIGIATVILPSLSGLHARENKTEFSSTIDWGLRVVCLMGMPALAGLMVLAQPIIMLLFMRGEFSQSDVQQVSYALYAYLSGLVSFMFIKVLAPGFYSRQDTKTPVKIGIIAMVANMAFNLMLAPFYGYVGLAMATTLSATLNAFLLYRGLKNSSVFTIPNKTKWFFAKLVVASALMASAIIYFQPSENEWFAMVFSQQLVHISGLIVAGVIVYFALLWLMRVKLSDFKVDKNSPISAR